MVADRGGDDNNTWRGARRTREHRLNHVGLLSNRCAVPFSRPATGCGRVPGEGWNRLAASRPRCRLFVRWADGNQELCQTVNGEELVTFDVLRHRLNRGGGAVCLGGEFELTSFRGWRTAESNRIHCATIQAGVTHTVSCPRACVLAVVMVADRAHDNFCVSKKAEGECLRRHVSRRGARPNRTASRLVGLGARWRGSPGHVVFHQITDDSISLRE